MMGLVRQTLQKILQWILLRSTQTIWSIDVPHASKEDGTRVRAKIIKRVNEYKDGMDDQTEPPRSQSSNA
jgi:hypothetical protein